MNPEILTTREDDMHDFKLQSLDALRAALAEQTYPGYPTERLTQATGGRRETPFGRYSLPHGAWHTNPDQNDWVGREEALQFQADGLVLDFYNRPVHPWIDQMLADPQIGVVTGKGAYWNWGPNYTADPIIVRVDQEEPHILLIKRADTHQWALPGGFIDPGEDAETAAKREGREETDLDVEVMDSAVTEVYIGPLADLRVTANAWPETTAYRLVLPVEETKDLSLKQYRPSSPEVEAAGWFAASEIDTVLRFGSHSLMTAMALKSL